MHYHDTRAFAPSLILSLALALPLSVPALQARADSAPEDNTASSENQVSEIVPEPVSDSTQEVGSSTDSDGSNAESQSLDSPSSASPETSDITSAPAGLGTSPESGLNQSEHDAQAPSASISPETPGAQSAEVAEDAIGAQEASIASLEGLRDKFADARAEYTRENDALQKLQDEHASTVAKIDKFRSEVERAQAVIDAATSELAIIEAEGPSAFLMRVSRASEIDAQIHLLRTLIDNRSEIVVSSSAAASGLERRKEELDLQMREQGSARRTAKAAVNACACEVEAACARARQQSSDTVSRIADASPDAAESWQAQAQRIGTGVSRIAEVESDIAAWYAETNAISSTRNALSFGEGADFAMNEAMFVSKWGNAIELFYDDYAKNAGEVALKGQGKTMATYAYRYRVDPRLCAAVSIAESSGGNACIKPFNAWGWGAADSNPYELAASWDSWEQAIEEWHKGMAGSKTGLASARTVSTLAIIYCSTPAWGASVAEAMGAISAKTL